MVLHLRLAPNGSFDPQGTRRFGRAPLLLNLLVNLLVHLAVSKQKADEVASDEDHEGLSKHF